MAKDDMVLRPDGLWCAGRRWPCVIGRGGVSAHKREGDGATPVGRHHIVGMLYRPDRMARPNVWATPIRNGDLWSDDPTRTDYNSHVRAPYFGSHEMLRRADPLYDLIVLTDWNWPTAQPGRGSAIFMHSWRRPGYPTEGCVAFHPADLRRLSRLIRLGTRWIVPDAMANR